MGNPGLGILSHELPDISISDVDAASFDANFRRWYGPQPKLGVVVVYFSGTEGVLDTPDERPTVNSYMANMIP